MEWQAKVRVQNERRARLKAQEPAWKGYVGSLMVKTKQNQQCEFSDY